jgi:hypothetical protein
MGPRTNTGAPGSSSSTVLEWRRDRLLEAGFARGEAADVASDPRVDLHAVLQLVDQGCPPELAARILAPLEDDLAAPEASPAIRRSGQSDRAAEG